MKKRLFVLVFILFFIGLTFISAQDSNPIEGIPGGDIIVDLAEGDNPSENIEDVLDRIRQERNDSDNGYLISQWKDQLLGNENIAAVNAVFAENDLIFRILFGVPYELSLTMFFIIALWFCVLLGLPDIIDSIDFFNKISSWIVSLLVVIILAQAQFFRVIVNLTDRLLFAPENGWIRLILGIIIFFIFVYIYYVEKIVGKYFNQLKKKRKDKEAEENPIAKQLEQVQEGLDADLGS
ncbi:MAG TPA: hypothetical protein QGG70_03260 [Candidatus Pacearchaeota archaeon]|jgi:hypothetical protein|nr:hypothetical protein [Candidatus Pacearchaeota archaeon]